MRTYKITIITGLSVCLVLVITSLVINLRTSRRMKSLQPEEMAKGIFGELIKEAESRSERKSTKDEPGTTDADPTDARESKA
ncbi:MAG: hypothetical protein AAFW00_19760 [Bacteroidota bacterium]